MQARITPEEIINWARENMSLTRFLSTRIREDLPKQGVKLLRRILRDEEESKTR